MQYQGYYSELETKIKINNQKIIKLTEKKVKNDGLQEKETK